MKKQFKNLKQKLDQLGADDWELVTPNGCFFQRPIE